MVAGVDQGDAFARDMGYSLTEFLRILPTALKGWSFEQDAGKITVRHPGDDRLLVLRVVELPDRRIAMMRISRVQVEFDFRNFSSEQRREFMTAFDRSYQRGGG